LECSLQIAFERLINETGGNWIEILPFSYSREKVAGVKSQYSQVGNSPLEWFGMIGEELAL
jgi:hypothetical protein